MLQHLAVARRRWLVPALVAGIALLQSSCAKHDVAQKPALEAIADSSKPARVAEDANPAGQNPAKNGLPSANGAPPPNHPTPPDGIAAAGNRGKAAGEKQLADAAAVGGRKSSADSKVRLADGSAAYRIARDYDQKLAVRVQNVSGEPHSIIGELIPPEGGLLGDFIGRGTKQKPLSLAPGESATLVLDLFAQDARRSSYDAHIKLTDSGSGETLLATALEIGVPLPKFALEAQTGPPDEGTLGIPIEVTNQGEVLTDVSVAADADLLGKVYFAPSVDHASLGTGQKLTFRALPVLDPSFRELKGKVTLRAAGGTRDVPVEFKLPSGKRVFVAVSASMPQFSSVGSYCTNNPNTNTPIGGPRSGPYHHRLPPIHVPPDQREYGPVYDPETPVRTGTPPINFAPIPDPDSDIPPTTPPGGALNPDPLQTAINNIVERGLDTGVKQIEDVGNVLGGMVDDPYGSITGRPTSADYRDQAVAQTRSPGGRKAYARHRPGIKDDNAPEAAWAIVGGGSPKATALFTWHSTPPGPKAHREVLVWGKDPISHQPRFHKPLRLSRGKRHARWPIVIGLRGRRALVLWEESDADDDDGDPSLEYSVSDPDMEAWSPPTDVPGADASDHEGNYDPFPVVAADGKVTLVWQRGAGKSARLLITRVTEKGVLAPPAKIDGLPTGASRPVARAAGDGGIHLIFQAPPGPAEQGVETAVFYARIPGGNTKAKKLARLSSPNVDAGEADLAVVGPALHAAFRAGLEGASQIVDAESDNDGTTWSDRLPATPDSLYAEFPAFVPRDDGSVELRFYGDARKPAGWSMIKRFATARRSGHWTEPERRLTHFPAVRSAWLEMKFEPRMPRQEYYPHELEVLLNGHTLIHQKNVVPEGNYLLPCDPRDFRSDSRGTGHNTIGLRTRHLNPGHYLYGAGFRLKARQAFLERLVIAKDQEDADRIVALETGDVNHSRPDVGLFNNHLTPVPATPKNGESIHLKLLAANVGEGKAEDVQVNVYSARPKADLEPASEPIAPPISVGALAPADSKMVDVAFPCDGKERYYVVITCRGDDFDPDNNVHVVTFPPPPRPQIQPEHYGQDQELVVRTGEDPSSVSLIRILDAESGRETARIANGRLAGSIPTGSYRLALRHFQYEGNEVAYPTPIQHERGQHQEVSLSTAIALSNDDGFAPVWLWEAARTDHPDQVIQGQTGQRTVMLLPPGDYHVILHPSAWDNAGGKLLWPETIHLEQNQRVNLRLKSGIELGVGARYAPLSKWEAVSADEKQTVIQWCRGDIATMVLPPGRYRIGIHPTAWDNYSQRLIWPQVVEVAPDRLTQVILNSGVELDARVDPQHHLNRWEVVDASAPKKTVQWQSGDRLNMLLPPGDNYRVILHPTAWDNHSGVLLWTQPFQLKENQRAVVHINSGLRLVLAEGTGAISSWEALAADAGDAAVQWQSGDLTSMWLPPGRYRIAIHPTAWDNNSQKLVWPTEFTVASGREIPARLDSGIRFIVPTDKKPEFAFRFVDLKAKHQVQWGDNPQAVQILPPADYRIEIRKPGYEDSWHEYVAKLSVEAGKVREVPWTGFPVEPAPKPKSSGAGVRRK
jgi:hypothetical protein